MATYTSEQIFEDLISMYESRDPVFIWGPPGIGKSDLVGQVARHLDIGLIDFRTALRDPTALLGFPMPDNTEHVMRYLRDAELPRSGKGILFFDEMNAGTPTMQSSCMQLALPPYKIGDYTLPDEWWVVAGGNREGDRGVTQRQPAPLANRFNHYEMECDVKAWVAWALNNGVHAEDIAFVRFRPGLLYTFDPKSADRAFGTPRSWVKAFRQARTAPNHASAMRKVATSVGEGNAAEYFGFLTMIRDLPSIDEIKLHPGTTRVPAEPATLYALVTALAINTTSDSGFSRFMDYVKRIPVDFQVVYVRDALKKVPAIAHTTAFTKFTQDHADVLM